MQAGNSFFLKTPGSRKAHLYVIISRPDSAGHVLCVSFSTNRGDWFDPACTVSPGRSRMDFIVCESFIHYAEAKAIDLYTIENNTRGHFWPPGERVPPDLLKRIQEGARKSKYLPRKFRPYFDVF